MTEHSVIQRDAQLKRDVRCVINHICCVPWIPSEVLRQRHLSMRTQRRSASLFENWDLTLEIHGNILSTVRMAIISRSCLHSANGKSISTRRPDRCCVSVTHSSLHCGVLGTRTLEELSRCLRRKMVSIMLHWKKQHWPRVSLFVGQRCKICIDLYFYACEPLIDNGTWQGYDPQTTEGCRAPSACLRGYERDCDRMW